MLQKICIDNFGSFKNFVWDDKIRDKGNNVITFKKLNIIYGRNYSGKTTLSKIFRILETGELPANYEEPDFTIYFPDKNITTSNLEEAPQNIRVYNSDFRRESLSFLHDPDQGVVEPFAIVGSANVRIESEINKIEEELGSIDDKTGLYYLANTQLTDIEDGIKSSSDFNSSLEQSLSKHAKTIKEEPFYEVPTYNKTTLKRDIEQVNQNNTKPLSDEEKSALTQLLQASPLPKITEKLDFSPQLDSLHNKVEEIVTKDIAPTRPLQDLLNDTVLQSWVQQGMNIHRQTEQELCGFCGNELPADLWKKLDDHFNKASRDLERELKSILSEIENELSSLDFLPGLDGSEFYISFREEYFIQKDKLRVELEIYERELLSLRDRVQRRLSNIYTSMQSVSNVYQTVPLTNVLSDLNDLFSQCNSQTDTLSADKADARRKLKLDSVLEFVTLEDYYNQISTRGVLESNVESFRATRKITLDHIALKKEKLHSLKTEVSSEQKAVEKVNEYLSHFFGHEGLRLQKQIVAEDDFDVPKFQILRNEEPAFNLSEGECSLISACYFFAKLSDANTKLSETIVFIDDPISSLDTNHIFFIFSLIDILFSKQGTEEMSYEQLFISTHNLDFLKYLKRLDCSDKKSAHFIIEKNKSVSSLRLMPEYLKNYVTEFNYLFEEIHNCCEEANSEDKSHSFYNFGNNLRKFLEAYLFFKYPYVSGQNLNIQKLRAFFSDDALSVSLTNRLSNEMSHLEEVFDRGMQPIDIPEISQLANFVIDRIFEKDPEQLNALLRSINQPERTE